MQRRTLGLVVSVGFVAMALAQAEDREPGAILDGPNYAFAIQTPAGWTMSSANAHGHVAEFSKKASGPFRRKVVLNISSVDKAKKHLKDPAEVNAADLDGIRKESPEAESKIVGEISTGDRRKIPLYSFSYGRYRELVAYADEPKTVTIFVLSAEDMADLAMAKAALEELVGSYSFLASDVTLPVTE